MMRARRLSNKLLIYTYRYRRKRRRGVYRYLGTYEVQRAFCVIRCLLTMPEEGETESLLDYAR